MKRILKDSRKDQNILAPLRYNKGGTNRKSKSSGNKQDVLFNRKWILSFIILLIIVFSSGCVSRDSQTKEVITGDPLIVSGKVHNYNGDVTIVLKGDDIDYSVIVNERGKTTKKFRRNSEYTFDLGHGYELKARTGSYHIRGWPKFINKEWSTRFYLYKDNQCVDKDGVSVRFRYHDSDRIMRHGNLTVSLPSRNEHGSFFTFSEELDMYWRFGKKIDNALSKVVKVENGIYKTQFDTSQLGGGKYFIEVYADELIDSYEVNMIPANIEELSIHRINDMYGTPITAVVTISNPDDEEKSLKLNLFLDGALYQSKSISLAPNSFTSVEFTLDQLPVGIHKINVGTLEETIEVKSVPFIRLNPIAHDVGIGNPLTISGTSNLPDKTKIEITIKNGVILAHKTVNIQNGRFNIKIATANAKEGIFNIIAEEPVQKLSDSTEVTFYVQYWDIKTVDLSVSPSTVIVGDKVTVDVTLKNTGNIVGTRDVILNIDGKAIESKTVTMQPNKMEKVSFDISTTQSDVGRHTVSVDDKTRVLTVKPTPRIDLDDTGDIKIGDELIISGSTNLEDGTEILIVIESDAYDFGPEVTTVENGKFTEKLDTSAAAEGIYKIIVKDAKVIHGAKGIGSVFLFSTKPGISISLSVSSNDILVGQTEKIFVRVTNSGDKKEEMTLSLKMDEMLKDTKTITVEANDFNTATFEIQNPDTGEHIIDVNGYKTMFTVTAPSPTLPHISTDRFSVDLYSTKTVVSRAENIIVTLSAVNKITNDKDLHLQLILTIPSGISATSSEGAFSITGGQATFDKVLKPGETISGITLNLVPNEVGSYTIKGDVIHQVGDEKFEEEVYLTIFVGS